ncbi:MAG: hypothetical protein V3T17_06990 [Pseudomonadales bacterium]
MSLEVSVNLNSLRIIREELNKTISQSATDFEAYLADRQNQGHIKSSRGSIAQVGGIFRLLECPGAALLSDEMAALIDVIADNERKTTDTMISVLTHAYFVLPCYIEYVSINQAELPILMIPYVNELRVSRKVDLLPEYHFYRGEIPTLCLLASSSDPSELPMLITTAPRLRHMYQIGLVGLLGANGKNANSSIHLQFMRRSVTRFIKLLGSHHQAEIWQIASATLEAFVAAKLEITLNRKRNLADIEKMFRRVVSNGEEGLNTPPPEHLKKDLLFTLMLTGADIRRPEIDIIREVYSLPELTISDADILAQRNVMHGPSVETIESVIKALHEELRNIKEILEITSQHGEIENDDLDLLKNVISRVADTLGILNLQGPQDTLREQLDKIETWGDESSTISNSDFSEVADTVLYIESALTGLYRRKLTVDNINNANEITRQKIIANNQFAVAEQLVIEEAQSGIALVKRAITSYADSNFDSAHIANVATTLNTVRGSLHILNYNRAAAVLKSCGAFISSHIEESNASNQRHQLLETFADALISLEYYLMELETCRDVNEKILDVAEKSLAALGFAVES